MKLPRSFDSINLALNPAVLQSQSMTHEEIADKAAKTAVADTVAKMQEFHRDEMKVMREYIDTRSDSLERSMNGRFDQVDSRLDRVETDISLLKIEVSQATAALTELLQEFKAHREKVVALEAEISLLRSRLDVLEAKVGV